jgi:hypothetical protein
MVDRDLETIAREWWNGDGTQDAFDEVWRIQEFDHERVPALLRALVDGVPPDRSIAYIGTSVLEDLMMEPDPLSAARVAELVNEAGLTREQIVLILTGMYPHYRVHLEPLL